MDSDLGSELRKMFTTDDKKSASIEAAKLLSSKDKDLALKTEIGDPINFATMGAISSYLKVRNMPKSAALIKDILDNFMVYMVSKDRKGRQEIIDVFKCMEAQPDEGFWDKFTQRQGTPP